MSALLATRAGWRASARSVRWSPIVTVPAVGVGMLLVLRALGGGAWGARGLVAEPALLLTATVVAFAVDDPALACSPSAPAGIRARLAGRVALVLPVVVLGWGTLLWVADLEGRGGPGLGERAIVAFALGAAPVAAATIASQRLRHASPGAVGAAAVGTTALVALAAPSAWFGWLPPNAWIVGIVLGGAALVIAVSTREPSA